MNLLWRQKGTHFLLIMESKVYHHEDKIRDCFIPASAILAVEERLEMISCLKRVISFFGSKKGGHENQSVCARNMGNMKKLIDEEKEFLKESLTRRGRGNLALFQEWGRKNERR